MIIKRQDFCYLLFTIKNQKVSKYVYVIFQYTPDRKTSLLFQVDYPLPKKENEREIKADNFFVKANANCRLHPPH